MNSHCLYILSQTLRGFVKFDFDGNAYWVERTSVTGGIAEATAAAGVVFTQSFDLL